MKIIGGIIGIIIVFFGIIFILNEFSLFGVNFWGVRQQDARRQVYEHSQSYVEGKRQELAKHYYEWQRAASSDKKAIEGVIRLKFANIDEELIQSQELRNFLQKCR